MPSPSGPFQPTSLDFISFPNPIEPSTFDFNLSSSGDRHLGIIADDDLFWSPRDSRFDFSPVDAKHGSRKRRYDGQLVSSNTVTSVLNPADIEIVPSWTNFARTSDQAYYQLPVPARRVSKHDRQRFPPVLQGLHQPPPNAGLLPSISTEKRKDATCQQVRPVAIEVDPELVSPRADLIESQGSRPQAVETSTSTDTVQERTPPAKKNKKWTEEESRHLIQGARRFGVGAWKAILTCPDYTFNQRRPLDLKDRFRILLKNDARAASLISDTTQPSSTEPAPTDFSSASTQKTIPGSSSLASIARTKRRLRTQWTADEDSALLAGITRHGRSWISIALDPRLESRTPTDIRDRIRTKFPEEYARSARPKNRDAALSSEQQQQQQQVGQELAGTTTVTATGRGRKPQSGNHLTTPGTPSFPPTKSRKKAGRGDQGSTATSSSRVDDGLSVNLSLADPVSSETAIRAPALTLSGVAAAPAPAPAPAALPLSQILNVS